MIFITDKQNKGLFVFNTVFIRTIIWLTLSGSPDNGPDKVSIENKMPFILYILLLSFISNLYIFHLISLNGIVSINRLTLMLKIIGQYVSRQTHYDITDRNKDLSKFKFNYIFKILHIHKKNDMFFYGSYV